MERKIWTETPDFADPYRQAYLSGIEEYIARMNRECAQARRTYFCPEKLKKDQERYRREYLQMLGLDTFLNAGTPKANLVYVGQDDSCDIYRLTVELTEEIPFYSLLMIPKSVTGPVPLVIAQHGGGGTPELCCDMYGKNNYNRMARRILERGAAVLAPQLLLWSQTEIPTQRAHPIPYNRQNVDRDLKRFGTSITAMEIAGIQRSLDYVSTLDRIDPERIAMIGLSYGGYFTLHTMAADTRIKAGYCAGVFNDRDTRCFGDWGYRGSAMLFQDAEVAALCAPRKLFVQVGKADPVFDYRNSLPEAEQAASYYAALGCPENFHFDLWEGGHTVSTEDTGYDFLFDALAETE